MAQETPPLTFAEALTLAQQFVTRIVRPFEKVEQVLLAAQDAESQIVAAQRTLDGLTQQIAEADATLAARQQTQKDFEGLPAAYAKKKGALDATLVAYRADHEKQRADIAAETAEVRGKLEAARAEYETFKNRFA